MLPAAASPAAGSLYFFKVVFLAYTHPNVCVDPPSPYPFGIGWRERPVTQVTCEKYHAVISITAQRELSRVGSSLLIQANSPEFAIFEEERENEPKRERERRERESQAK
jgi:hypothetical protein